MLPFLTKYITDVSTSIDALDMNEVQYSKEFEAIESEIQKLQSLVPEKPNWDLILNQGNIVLKEQGKHLKIITYIVVAMYKKYKLIGLLAGLQMLANILENEKDQIMPYGKRKKSRSSLITWMVKFISDYREESFTNIPLKDLEDITIIKQKVNDWFLEVDSDSDSLPLLQIYSWFENAKLQLEAVQNTQKQNNISEELEEDSIVDLEAEKEEIPYQDTTNSTDEYDTDYNADEYAEESTVRREIEATSFIGVRQFVIQELLERLENVGEDSSELFKLMSQSRKILWNSIYYDNLVDDIADEDISDDYMNLNNIAYISDPLIKIIELEKLYIKNPYLIEVQKYILETLEDGYMRHNDLAYKKMYEFIIIELKFLISQTPDIFEFYYVDKQCIPQYLYDWVFTQLVDDISPFREKLMDEYLNLYEIDFKISKLKKYIKNTKNIELKMIFLLEVISLFDGDDQTKILFLEKELRDENFIREILQSSPSLKIAYQSLAEYYEVAAATIADVSIGLSEKILDKRSVVLEKIQL